MSLDEPDIHPRDLITGADLDRRGGADIATVGIVSRGVIFLGDIAILTSGICAPVPVDRAQKIFVGIELGDSELSGVVGRLAPYLLQLLSPAVVGEVKDLHLRTFYRVAIFVGDLAGDQAIRGKLQHHVRHALTLAEIEWRAVAAGPSRIIRAVQVAGMIGRKAVCPRLDPGDGEAARRVGGCGIVGPGARRQRSAILAVQADIGFPQRRASESGHHLALHGREVGGRGWRRRRRPTASAGARPAASGWGLLGG